MLMHLNDFFPSKQIASSTIQMRSHFFFFPNNGSKFVLTNIIELMIIKSLRIVKVRKHISFVYIPEVQVQEQVTNRA
jgi:hypothetical protein